jgi:alpha-tubulin suppressor-like RCC1 family protein
VMKSLVGLSIRQISCGNEHVVAITEGGLAYSWGHGALGKLGHGNENDVREPQLISSLKYIPLESISCGHAFNIAISKAGQLYSWGAGGNGRLGLGDELNRSLPNLVEPFCQEKLLSKFISLLLSNDCRN